MDRLDAPLSWDEVGFREFQEIVLQACEPEIARPIVAANRAAEFFYENPGRTGTRPRAVDPDVRRRASSRLREFVGRQRAALRQRMKDLDGAYLLGAVSILGALPEQKNPDPVAVPGRYDREVEWLSRIALSAEGRIPTWAEAMDALHTARRCLLADYYDPAPDDAPSTKLRKRSVMAGDLGVTYVQVARELTRRLLQASVVHHHAIGAGHLVSFLDETERVFDLHVRGLAEMVLATTPPPLHVADHTRLLSSLMQAWDLQRFVDSVALDPDVASHPSIRDLTTPASALPASSADLRAQPLIALGDSALLLLPRRIATDRHEVLDHAIGRFLRSAGAAPGVYPDLRARMLDDVVAESLAQLLPGSRIVVGQDWEIGGRVYERDVVAFSEDIAICVETKAARMVPSARSTHQDVVRVLRDDMATGVQQVTSIADALEAGAASIAGTPLPRVRRAYRLVASFNSWWGIDLAVEELRDAGVMPALDTAMLTSADKFVCFEKLFESPADFIAYLDHRLSHQRRPWITVSDEFELIGGYFTNPRGDWHHRPPATTSYLIKATFQDDVDETMRAVLTGQGKRSDWVQRKHLSLIADSLSTLEAERPEAWLQAFSALSRLPLTTQLELDAVVSSRRGRRDAALHSVPLPGRAGIAILVPSPEAVTRRAWENVLRNASTDRPLVAVEPSRRRILAARGVDDAECWLDPEWAALMSRSVAPTAVRVGGRGQRNQPQRRRRT